jgi:hypothetical protein
VAHGRYRYSQEPRDEYEHEVLIHLAGSCRRTADPARSYRVLTEKLEFDDNVRFHGNMMVIAAAWVGAGTCGLTIDAWPPRTGASRPG